MFEQIHDEEALLQHIQASPAILLKHSPRCIVCDWAYDALHKYERHHPDISCRWIDIQANRPLSNLIEARTGIKHQTPQIFLFVDGEVRWSEAFSKINFAAIVEAMDDYD